MPWPPSSSTRWRRTGQRRGWVHPARWFQSGFDRMHVLLVKRFPGGIVIECECGILLNFLATNRTDFGAALEETIQGHRQHVLIENGVPCAWREGSTTQAIRPIVPKP